MTYYDHASAITHRLDPWDNLPMQRDYAITARTSMAKGSVSKPLNLRSLKQISAAIRSICLPWRKHPS